MDADKLEQFDEEIGMVTDPAEWAREELRRHQEEAGMTFDDPDAPVAPDEKYLAQMEDREIGGQWMGGGRGGRR
jgi:hypothetical protein